MVILRIPQAGRGSHEDVVQSGGGLIRALAIGLAALQLRVLLTVAGIEVVRISIAVLAAAISLFCDYG